MAARSTAEQCLVEFEGLGAISKALSVAKSLASEPGVSPTRKHLHHVERNLDKAELSLRAAFGDLLNRTTETPEFRKWAVGILFERLRDWDGVVRSIDLHRPSARDFLESGEHPPVEPGWQESALVELDEVIELMKQRGHFGTVEGGILMVSNFQGFMLRLIQG